MTRRANPPEGEMRAAVLHAYGQPLDLRTVPTPTPGPDEALVRVRAVGLCGTDLKLISGALAGSSPLPMIPGHEVAGEVVAGCGHELDRRRVACYIYEFCGACRICLAGHPTACREAIRIGVERDGGMATYVAVKRANLLPFADHVPDEWAAVAMDAVASPWAALRARGGIGPGMSVLIVGAGGLGIHATQIARSAGAAVAVVDPAESRRRLALALGAELAVPPERERDLWQWSRGGVDVALESSGVRAGFEVAARSLRPGGRLMCNGYQAGVEYGLESLKLVLDEMEIVGSRSASREHAQAALTAVERGDVRPQISESIPLADVNDAIATLARGAADGRIVIRM
jgi:D-arabinose 1-dehydrogenase-like Zn-dependent alcohol dehydrogenase